MCMNCFITERKAGLMDLERKLDKISFHFSRTGKIYDDCLVVYFATVGFCVRLNR